VRTRVLSVDRMTLWSTSSSDARDLPSNVEKFGRRRHAPTHTGLLPPSPSPPGCTERVRQYLRNYLTMASNLQLDEQGPVLDGDALALWLARPPSLLLSRLDDQLGGVVLSSPEMAYLRKELISILCQLLIGTRNLWRLRCAGAFEKSTESTAMTCGRLTPKVSLSSQRTIFSYFPSLPFSLSLDPPLLDSQVVGPLDLQGPRSSQPSQVPPWEPPWDSSSSGFSLLSPMSPILPASPSPSTSQGTGGVEAGCSPSSPAQGLFPVHGALLEVGPDGPSLEASIPFAFASPYGSVSPTPSEDSEYAFQHFLSVQDLASVPDCTIGAGPLLQGGTAGVPCGGPYWRLRGALQ
jgi:hypothetical protein